VWVSAVHVAVKAPVTFGCGLVDERQMAAAKVCVDRGYQERPGLGREQLADEVRPLATEEFRDVRCSALVVDRAAATRSCVFGVANVVVDEAGLRRDSCDPAPNRRPRREIDACVRRDVCVCKQRDVGNGKRIANEEVAPSQPLLEEVEAFLAVLSPRSDQLGCGVKKLGSAGTGGAGGYGRSGSDCAYC